jgi:hypothetical protein
MDPIYRERDGHHYRIVLSVRFAATLLFLLAIASTPALTFPHGGAGSSAPIVASTNATYALPILNYATNGGCATNYYVNKSTGSDSYTGASQTFTSGSTGPWATIGHAETTLAGSKPATCINVASGTYPEDVILQAHGSTNTYAGYAALRCAPNASTATARPQLYALTNGAQGSQPACKISSAGDGPPGGIVATSNGTTAYSYVIVDGFEITSTDTVSFSVTGLSYNAGSGQVTLAIGGNNVTSFAYNSGTGIVTLGLTSSLPAYIASTVQVSVSGLTGTGSIASANGTFPAASGTAGTTLTYNVGTGLTLAWSSGGAYVNTLLPKMCSNISGLTGTGSIASADGYWCFDPGTAGATVKYTIASGLTLAYSSGGTFTTPTPGVGDVGIGQGAGNVSPNGHHLVFANNLVHDVGGACIQTAGADVYYVLQNVVYSCGWESPFGESGLDFTASVNASFTAAALDGQLGSLNGTAIHDLIANNVVHNIGNPVGDADGNMIIFDGLDTEQTSTCSATTYSYARLVYGNVGFYNAGSGVHVYNSSNVGAFNNTAYQNGQSILASALVGGLDSFCGTNNVFKDNIGVAIVGAGTQANVHAAFSRWSNPTMGSYVLWNNNILNTVGSQSGGCSEEDAQGNAYACWNGRDQVFNSALSLTQVGGGYSIAPWSSSTTYSGTVNDTTSAVTAVVGGTTYTFSALSGSTNLNHNPATDAPTPGTQGSWWQNNGAPNNLFEDPLITTPGTSSPVWTLQSGSPALNASGADVTALGGYAVATPNIGAQ